MPNPFRKVRPGDQVRIPAEVWNASLEAARAEQQRQHGANSAALSQQRSSDIVRIRNGTGGALPRGSILGIAGPIFGPDMSEAAFLREVAFRGVTPTADHAGRFVVLLEPAADGQVVRGWAAGSCPCVVNVVDEADDRCDVDAGETGRLVSSTTGSAQIVWKESGTGEKNAIIRFGSTCCTAPEPTDPCDGQTRLCYTITDIDDDDPIPDAEVKIYKTSGTPTAEEIETPDATGSTGADGVVCIELGAGFAGDVYVIISAICYGTALGSTTVECGTNNRTAELDFNCAIPNGPTCSGECPSGTVFPASITALVHETCGQEFTGLLTMNAIFGGFPSTLQGYRGCWQKINLTYSGVGVDPCLLTRGPLSTIGLRGALVYVSMNSNCSGGIPFCSAEFDSAGNIYGSVCIGTTSGSRTYHAQGPGSTFIPYFTVFW